MGNYSSENIERALGLLILLCFAFRQCCCEDSTATSGSEEILAIKGKFESHVYDSPDGATENKYVDAFKGISAAVEVFRPCYHAQIDRLMEKGEMHMSEKSTALNELQTAGRFTLACCSNTVCVDDDYDGRGVPQRDPPEADSEWRKGGANGRSVPDSGNCKGTAFFDWWRVRCPLISGKTSLASIKEQLKTKSQIRLLQNIEQGSGQLTVCEFPRMGKTYAKCDPRELAYYHGNFCKRFSPNPHDMFTCGGDDIYSAQWRVTYPSDCADVPEGKPCWACHDNQKKKNQFCQCRVPQGWFEVAKAIDDSATCKETDIGAVPSCRAVVGYTLKLGIAEEGGQADGGKAWRSVRTCEVTSYEWYNNALEPNDWDKKFEFQQDFVMISFSDYDPMNPNDILYWLAINMFVAWLCVEILSCMRARNCHCCVRRLKVGAVVGICMDIKRCFWCWLYNAPLPDPTLYAALKARDEHLRGKGFFQHSVQGPLAGRFRYVRGTFLTGRRIYIPPRMKAVDHKLSLQKPIKVKDLLIGYDQRRNQTRIAPIEDIGSVG